MKALFLKSFLWILLCLANAFDGARMMPQRSRRNPATTHELQQLDHQIQNLLDDSVLLYDKATQSPSYSWLVDQLTGLIVHLSQRLYQLQQQDESKTQMADQMTQQLLMDGDTTTTTTAAAPMSALEAELQVVQQQLKSVQELLDSITPPVSSSSSILLDWPTSTTTATSNSKKVETSPTPSSSWSDIIQVGQQIERASQQGLPADQLEAMAQSYWQTGGKKKKTLVQQMKSFLLGNSDQEDTLQVAAAAPEEASSSIPQSTSPTVSGRKARMKEAQKKADSVTQQMEAFLLGDDKEEEEEEDTQEASSTSAIPESKPASDIASPTPPIDVVSTREVRMQQAQKKADSVTQQMEALLLSDDDDEGDDTTQAVKTAAAQQEASSKPTTTTNNIKSRRELVSMANEIDEALVQGQDFGKVEQMVNDYREAKERADGLQDELDSISDNLELAQQIQQALETGDDLDPVLLEKYGIDVEDLIQEMDETKDDEQMEGTMDAEPSDHKEQQRQASPTTTKTELTSSKDLAKPDAADQAEVDSVVDRVKNVLLEKSTPPSEKVGATPVDAKTSKPDQNAAINRQPGSSETPPEKLKVHSPLFFADEVVHVSAKVDISRQERSLTLKDELDRLERMASTIQQAARDGTRAVTRVAQDGTQAVTRAAETVTRAAETATKAAETVESGVKQRSDKVVKQSFAVGSKIGAAWAALTSAGAKVVNEISKIQSAIPTTSKDEMQPPVAASEAKSQARKDEISKTQSAIATPSKDEMRPAFLSSEAKSQALKDDISKTQSAMATQSKDEMQPAFLASEARSQRSKGSDTESSDEDVVFATEMEPPSFGISKDDDESPIVENFRKLKIDEERVREMAKSIQSTTVRAAKGGTELAAKIGSILAPIAGAAISKAWNAAINEWKKSPSSAVNETTTQLRSDTLPSLDEVWSGKAESTGDGSGEDGQQQRTTSSMEQNEYPDQELDEPWEDLAQAWNSINATTDPACRGIDSTKGKSSTRVTKPRSDTDVDPASAAWQRVGRAWRNWNEPSGADFQADTTNQEDVDAEQLAKEWSLMNGSADRSAEPTKQEMSAPKQNPVLHRQLYEELEAGIEQLSKGLALLDLPTETIKSVAEDVEVGIEQLEKGLEALNGPLTSESTLDTTMQPPESLSNQSWEQLAQEWKAVNSESPSSTQAVGFSASKSVEKSPASSHGPPASESTLETVKQPAESLGSGSWEQLAQEWKAVNSESPSSNKEAGFSSSKAAKEKSPVSSNPDEIITSWEEKTKEVRSYLEQLANNWATTADSSASFEPNYGDASLTAQSKSSESVVQPKLAERNSFSQNAQQLDSYMEKLANRWARRDAELKARVPADIESLDAYIKSPNILSTVDSDDKHSTPSQEKPRESLTAEWAAMNDSSNTEDRLSRAGFESKNVDSQSFKRDQPWDSLAAEWATRNGSPNPPELYKPEAPGREGRETVSMQSSARTEKSRGSLASEWAAMNGSSNPMESPQSKSEPDRHVVNSSNESIESLDSDINSPSVSSTIDSADKHATSSEEKPWGSLAAEWAAMNGSSNAEDRQSRDGFESKSVDSQSTSRGQSGTSLASEWATRNGSSNPPKLYTPEVPSPETVSMQSSASTEKLRDSLASEWAAMNGSSNPTESPPSGPESDRQVVDFSNEPEMEPSRPDWQTLAQEWAERNR